MTQWAAQSPTCSAMIAFIVFAFLSFVSLTQSRTPISVWCSLVFSEKLSTVSSPVATLQCHDCSCLLGLLKSSQSHPGSRLDPNLIANSFNIFLAIAKMMMSTFIRTSGGGRPWWQRPPLNCGIVPSLRRLLHPWFASTKVSPQPLPPVWGEAGRLWGI